MRLILALILALASTGQAQPAITWSNIVWDSGSVTLGGQTVDHAALLLAVRLDGLDAPGVMQLDTGTPATVLHREVYGKLRRDLFNGSLAGRRFENERFSIRQDAAEPPRPGRPIRLGTIGATFFEHRVLLIDFVRQRVAILDSGGDLPPAIARRFEFLPLEYRNYKMFVPLSIAGAAEYDLAFDTGSSAVPLFTSRRLWTGWTGREPADRRNTPLTGKAWGKGVTLLGAPLKATLCAGNACLSAPLIFFDPSGLPSMDLDRSPYRISGIFGNRLFDGRYTIVIDLPHRRFGILAGSLD